MSGMTMSTNTLKGSHLVDATVMLNYEEILCSRSHLKGGASSRCAPLKVEPMFVAKFETGFDLVTDLGVKPAIL
jgi:hypothetical protein